MNISFYRDKEYSCFWHETCELNNQMNIKTITTSPFTDQKPGTSGLRKKVGVFQAPHYLENFVQSVFDVLPPEQKNALLIGGDGRFYNREAIQVIIRMAVANGYKKIIVGRHGFVSTPAASHLIRKHKLSGGIILSASHNPGGPGGDFGIKYNIANGGPAPESFTNRVFETSKQLTRYLTVTSGDIELNKMAVHAIEGATVSVIDAVTDYADLMEHLFDFDLISNMFGSGLLSMAYDAMHAITGPYATEILIRRLGATEESVLNGQPLPDFGGGHPDPNLAHAKELVSIMNAKTMAPVLGAASDGDGDRNMIMGRGCFVTPSDSLAIMAANAHLLPGYRNGLCGVARSMPTSMAVDRVAAHMGIECYETPTGWKFFGNLLDAGLITLCGEESFGTGSDHIREKDGLWAVLFWLNMVAVKKQSVSEMLHQHWHGFGRNYYCRHDYEAVETSKAQAIFGELNEQLTGMAGRQLGEHTVEVADNFSYRDPVDNSVTDNQGLRLIFKDGSRIVFRLSGTGTEGATIRVYYEAYQSPDGVLDAEPQQMLAPLFAIAQQVGRIHELSGRSGPDVIT
jgi:phosphoglucomutase